MAESNKELIERLDKVFTEYDKFRKELEPAWKEQERFLAGKQWKHAVNRPVENYVFSIIQSEIPILTDGLPSTSVISRQEEKKDHAKVLEVGIEHVNQDQSMILKQAHAVKDLLTTGNGWVYTTYDPDGRNGDGRILKKVYNWRYVWVDPAATELDEAKGVILKMPMKIDEIKRLFPDKASEIMAQTITSNITGDIIVDGSDPNTAPVGKFDQMEGGIEGTHTFELRNSAIFEEYWLKDYSTEDIPPEEIA